MVEYIYFAVAGNIRGRVPCDVLGVLSTALSTNVEWRGREMDGVDDVLPGLYALLPLLCGADASSGRLPFF